MKKVIKKIMALLVVLTMLFTAVPTAFAGVEYSVEEAYAECAELYPDFVAAITKNGATEAQIINFLRDIQEYLLALDVEITEENFEDYMFEAVSEVIQRRPHIKLRDALAAAFPGAVVDAMDGIISPEFEPILETVKMILFGTHEEETEPTNEETTQPTEQPEEKPTQAPTEEPTEAPTEEPTKKPDNGNGGGTGGGYDDEGEDVTEAVTQAPTQPPTQSITFSDINQAPWAEVAVKALVERKIINGYPDGTFKPNNPITRAEFAKIIVLASGRYDAKATCTFTDVPKERWDYVYVASAFKNGFIKGRSETVFDPASNITRADLCTVVYRFIKSINPEFKVKTDANGVAATFADAANVPSYAQEAVSALFTNNVAPVRDSVNNKFEPTLPATRAECALIVYNAINASLGITK